MAKVQQNAAKVSKGNGKAAKASRKPQDASKAAKGPKVAAKAAKPQNGPEAAYRVGGGYWASVVALKALGIGKLHAFDRIVPAVRKAMTDAGTYKAFAAKEARNDDSGKDTEGRILQNVSVVARKDYGAPLRELGYEVRWDGREKVAGLFRTK